MFESTHDFRLKIARLNNKGAGVGTHNGIQVVVEKTLPGETVLLNYSNERLRKQRIRLVEILESSPDRQSPPCQYYVRCGGCHLQHMADTDQLEYKREIVKDELGNYERLNGIDVHPLTASPSLWNYRNKAQLPLQTVDGKTVVGLYESGSHKLVPITECLVESETANNAFDAVVAWANHHALTCYSERSGKGLLRYIIVRHSKSMGQTMVTLVANDNNIPFADELIDLLEERIPTLNSVYLNVNTAASNIILGSSDHHLWGQPYIEERLNNIVYRIYPQTFFQVNTGQAEQLLKKLKSLAHLDQNMVIIDLFCGSGLFALQMASEVQHVYGIETVDASVAAARENADRNNIGNVEFFCDSAEAGMQHLSHRNIQPDAILVDPPRKGLTEKLINEITRTNVGMVIYVSCNPVSFARDLNQFAANGYTTTEVYPFDMFPQTYHVECVSVLRR